MCVCVCVCVQCAALPAPVKGEPGYDSLSGYESYAGYESCDVEDRETQTEGQQSVIETEGE